MLACACGASVLSQDMPDMLRLCGVPVIGSGCGASLRAEWQCLTRG